MSEVCSFDTSSLIRTFFADQTIIPVVRVVGIAEPSVRVFKFEELVAVLARVSCAAAQISNAPSGQTERAMGGNLLVSIMRREQDVSPAHAVRLSSFLRT